MLKPFAVGAAMAAMMLWMLHEPIMAGTADLTWGAVVFVLAHVVLVAAALLLGLLIPRLRRALKRHRPNLAHLSGMVWGLVTTAVAIHLVVHGGIA